MNSQDLSNLQEAYLDVYENEYLDEASVSWNTGKRKVDKVGPIASKRFKNAAIRKRGGKQPSVPIKTVSGLKDANKESQSKLNKEQVDLYDIILSHLLDEGYAETQEQAEVIMVNMSEEWRQSIVEAPGEWFGGLRDKASASRASQIQSMQPTPKPLPSIASPFAKPASKDDSGKLSTYGAGGGAAAERAGQTQDQVMRQGAINRERKNKPQPVNQGPNFGR